MRVAHLILALTLAPALLVPQELRIDVCLCAVIGDEWCGQECATDAPPACDRCRGQAPADDVIKESHDGCRGCIQIRRDAVDKLNVSDLGTSCADAMPAPATLLAPSPADLDKGFAAASIESPPGGRAPHFPPVLLI